MYELGRYFHSLSLRQPASFGGTSDPDESDDDEELEE